MKLAELIKKMGASVLKGNVDVQINDIVCNSSDASGGSCFVALHGVKADGHDYVESAIQRGASAVVVEKEPPGDCADAAVIKVGDSRFAMAKMSQLLCGEPSKKMGLVGVTGTNGKTTVTYILEKIFREAGMIPGVIGTVSCRFGGIEEPSSHTTPESNELARMLARMVASKVDCCAMEVSSHALAQKRVHGCHFDAAVFMNLSHEHLDYHRDMEDYFAAKSILFEELLPCSEKRGAFAAINADDEYGRILARKVKMPVMMFGCDKAADLRAVDIKASSCGLEMSVQTKKGLIELKSGLMGKFNVSNILAAMTVALGMNLPVEVVVSAIARQDAVPGRFEAVKNEKGVLAFVDYAHKPDALENVLKNAREILNGNGGRMITVFGCGGDRDKGKRPLMGKVAASLSDIVIVTSDNPRTEDPLSIISEIVEGVKKNADPYDGVCGYEIIADRKDAIGRAVELASCGDVLIVAGKGHEDYQILGDTKIHFDDREVLGNFLTS